MECPAGAIFLSWRPLEVAVAAVECVDEAEAPMPCVSAYAPEKSHAILLAEVLTKSENVAIPTI